MQHSLQHHDNSIFVIIFDVMLCQYFSSGLYKLFHWSSVCPYTYCLSFALLPSFKRMMPSPLVLLRGCNKRIDGRSQDGGVRRRGVNVSPQLGHLPAAGGGLTPKGMGGTPE